MLNEEKSQYEYEVAEMTLHAVSGDSVKQPAVAGMFYPADAGQLRGDMARYLEDAELRSDCRPRALIVPHAGYIYSGPIAAWAYRQLENLPGRIGRVLLLGPAHRVGFHGIAAHSADSFRTPLGDVPLDRDAVSALIDLPFVHPFDKAFTQEHCLEVQLPFLQQLLSDFTLVPLVVGQSDFQQVAQVLEQFVEDPQNLILISSDLSHYHGYQEAQRMDTEASRSILELDPAGLGHDHACGRIGIGGLLLVARKQGWTAMQLDLRNSGDTAGPRDQVVGYGAYAFV